MFGEQSMAKILDFKTKYAPKIFAIDPGFSKSSALGWSMINVEAELFGGITNKPHIDRCGILKPFSNESNLATMNDLCDGFIDIWRKDSGYSREPTLLVVELPIIYPGSPVAYRCISDLILFAGMLVKSLSPQMTIMPTPNEWKGNNKKNLTQESVINGLDFYSKKALERDLESIALDKRHNVFDALGLGIYGGNILAKKQPLPRMVYGAKH